jgi:excinuclease ABC subunit B
VRGRAILYADRITDSMRKAIDETARRRTRQIEHNAAHGITPKTIIKSVTDILEGARDSAAGGVSTGSGRRGRAFGKVAEPVEDYRLLTPAEATRRIREIEVRMFKHAQDLEFEHAAALRDEIRRLKAAALLG